MAKEMLVNVSEGEECRIALLENDRLEELYMERTSSTSHVGNIYKGRVTNVEPSIQAAFVDFGLGRNGFLHISDLMPSYFGRKGEDIVETVGKKLARRDRPPIQRCLRRGDEITVQIIKEGIGTKGPTLSTYLSIPGRILVMMPGMGKMGVSRKIEDDGERRRLRQILDSLKPPKDVAFIIRTAGVDKSKTEIERDLKYLTRLWETIEKKLKEHAPVELYTEGDLVTRTVRDVYSPDLDRIIVDNKDVAKRIKEFIKISAPRTRNKVELYEDPVPLFHKYGIEREIELMYSRHVPLPSGGSLVIDSTEAIVAIDVNSGKFREHADAETTAFRTDMEAADEIPRQLKLRDLGGVIICDFIDLRYERHRRELERCLHDNFKRDRAKTKVLNMSQFGIIEMTRQRMRPSLKRSIYFDCPHCKGAGLVKTPESMSLDVMRRLAIAVNDLKVVRVEMAVCPDVAFYLQNKKRRQLADLEVASQKRILVRSDPTLGLDETRFELFDIRDGLVILEELGMTLPVRPHTTQLGARPPQTGGRGRDRGRLGDRGRGNVTRQPPRGQPPAMAHLDDDEEPEEAERFELEHADEAAEDNEQHPEPAEHAEPHADAEIGPDADQEDEVDRPAPPPSRERQPAAARGAGDETGEQGGPRRRRRRRRGRGRGRGGAAAGAPTDQPHDEAPLNDDHSSDQHDAEEENEQEQPVRPAARADEDADESSDGDSESAPDSDGNVAAGQEGDSTGPRRRRRRRGGRRRRGRGGEGAPANTSGDEPNVDAPAEPVSAQRPSPRQRPADDRAEQPRNTNGPRIIDQPMATRSGSTDRHLVSDDEPVAPQPISRPRTYRDLDAIPDDFD